MGFSCECWSEGPTFYNEARVRARKVHRCCECAEDIEPGHEYQRISGKWEHEVASYKTCTRCADLREAYSEKGYCWYFGTLWDDHLDMLPHGADSAIQKARAVIYRRNAIRAGVKIVRVHDGAS